MPSTYCGAGDAICYSYVDVFDKVALNYHRFFNKNIRISPLR